MMQAKTSLMEALQAEALQDSVAQFLLGYLHAAGKLAEQDAVEQNRAKAFEWWLKAATNGYADAQFRVGRAYALGEGVEQNKAKELEWYHSAAKQGHPDALDSLGFAYVRGAGVEQNDREAYIMFALATLNGHTTACFARDAVARKLEEFSPADLQDIDKEVNRRLAKMKPQSSPIYKTTEFPHHAPTV